MRRLATGLAPAPQEARAGKHGFQFPELVNSELPARSRGQTKIADFTCRPLRTVVNPAAKQDTCAHVIAYIDEDEILDSLSSTAKVLALCSQIRIVLDNNQ